MRLDKYLSDMNVGTRKELKKMLRSGNVTVGGSVCKDPAFSVNVPDEVCVMGKPVRYAEYEYYMLNKPAGVISASEDPKQATVMDLFENVRRKDLFPVGRLDKDTVGLLLITNDGELAHRLLSPKNHVDKVYTAVVRGIVTEQEITAFRDGLAVDDSLTALPAVLEILDTDPALGQSRVNITIREGKFHQIKRMFAAVGMEVLYLKRLSMGSLKLDETLEEGAVRPLRDDEISALKNGCGL